MANQHSLAKSDERVHLTLFEAAVLLVNLYHAGKNPNVGFEDTEHVITDVAAALIGSAKVHIKHDVLESAMWASNLLDERNEFWHPRDGVRFTTFIRDLLKNNEIDFDRRYNTIRRLNL